MIKLPICEICKVRKIKQQEWKTEEEKKRCMTCHTAVKFLIDTLEVLQSEFDRRDVRRRICCVLDNDRATPEDKLMKALYNKSRIYFGIKD